MSLSPELRKRLAEVCDRHAVVERSLAEPEVLGDPEAYKNAAKEHSELSELVDTFDTYQRLEKELEENQILLGEDDPELVEMAQAEIDSAEARLPELEDKISLLLLPKDPNDDKNVLLEIRAGTGGDEAALFAADLLRMYLRFAELKGWKHELMDSHPTDAGGFKEVIVMINGQGAYSQLKYESGVHRVQRVPATESQGRIHTSAVTVAVMPEAEEVELDINPEELRIDFFRSSGPGGQHVNTTDSAVRITHLPTNLVVSCQDEKSQHKNKAKAMKVLRARLYDKMLEEAAAEQAAARKSMVGSGDRSERIRTYNFPQGRVSDHRIGLTLYKLEQVLAGEMDHIIPELIQYFQTEALKADSDADADAA
ncbi:MAG: peptide chain release factor 1 [Desulfarculaceae bacterium]|nr:peptide chain release factor 1 [Desulfarculaceae bacterium]MCF8070832.1 peptide chain release factor 1 [Desulfarculaceae bacterium]MCF8102269.1 peptide chain release factor 1 [Desulfarculaceae bacterium]MCF8118038.1 peptide chain release factor 1 [Desulfarculaceae bacterium]